MRLQATLWGKAHRLSKRAVSILSLLLAGFFLSIPVAALAWHGSKTVTTMSGTLTNPGTLTGTISVSKIPGGTTLTLVDAFQAVQGKGGGGCDSNTECERESANEKANHTAGGSSGDSSGNGDSSMTGDSSANGDGGGKSTGGNGGTSANRFYQGTYTFTFTNCIGGTATGGTETIGAGGTFPGSPPTNSGAPTFTLGLNSTAMSCDYSVSFTGKAPAGTISGLQNDVWMLFDGSVQAAFSAAQTPGAVLPEAPLAVLLPFSGLAIVGGALFLIRRRGARTSPNSVT